MWNPSCSGTLATSRFRIARTIHALSHVSSRIIVLSDYKNTLMMTARLHHEIVKRQKVTVIRSQERPSLRRRVK
jgi:hypothetical protein